MDAAKHRSPRSGAVAWTALAAVLATGTAGAEPEYDLIVIEPWDTTYSLATSGLGDINDLNVAVGIAYDSGPAWNNFLWEEGTGKVRADVGGGHINDIGFTAGGGALYSAPGDYILIPHPAGGAGVGIRDLNNANVVTGSAPISERTLGFVWDEQNGSRYLEALGVPPTSWRGIAVNDAGRLVGSRSQAGEPFDQEAFLLDLETSEYVDLHRLLNPLGHGRTEPNDINELGVVLGEGSFGDDAGIAAFTWSPSAGFTFLPGLGGGLTMDVHPNSINDDGVAVGAALDGSGEWRAFRWSPADGMVDLETLVDVPAGFNVEEADAINDAGWIIGRGFWGTAWGPARAFVLVPRTAATVTVPAPGDRDGFSMRVPSPVRSSVALIEMTLPHPAEVRLGVYDVRGREVALLVSGRRFPAGRHVEWWRDGGASGVYFVRLDAGERRSVKKLVRVN